MTPDVDPRLRELAERLEATRWAAELCDPSWRLVWVSEEFQALVGHEVAVGEHLIASRAGRAFDNVSEAGQEAFLRTNLPYLLDATDGGREAVAAMVRPHQRTLVEEIESSEAPLRWTGHVDWEGTHQFSGRVHYLAEQIRDAEGELLGWLYLYGPSLPASVLALVASGEAAVFERMARLVEPGRREAAVLFADLEASGRLSRRLPTARYFELLQRFTTEIDASVVRHAGLVGKHAGDGVTALFLAEEAGSDSEAAAAAVEVAREAAQLVDDLADGELVQSHDLALNAGLHWGSGLYVGQVVTGGRLEVTALGDEMNECARIEQSAKGGSLLASKPLIERLATTEAHRLGLEPGEIAYTPLAELAGASEKAIHDAGGVAVARL